MSVPVDNNVCVLYTKSLPTYIYAGIKWLMLLPSYYPHIYAGIIGSSLLSAAVQYTARYTYVPLLVLS